MGLREAHTHAKLIDPARHARGRTEILICREGTAGAIEVIAGRARRGARGRVGSTLRVKAPPEDQPVAVVLMAADRPGEAVRRMRLRHNP